MASKQIRKAKVTNLSEVRPIVKSKFKEERRNRPCYSLEAKTQAQQDLINAITGHTLTVALGVAGSGKTYCAASMAAKFLLDGTHDKIILVRANVSTGKSLGYLPGTASEKLTPWVAPMLNVLKLNLGFADYEARLDRSILLQPLEMVRGCSFDDAIILVDECQNLSIEELKAITTRIGENTKMILMGDATQSDVANGTNITRFAEMAQRHDVDIPVVCFGIDDIVRSDTVAKLVKMFYREGI